MRIVECLGIPGSGKTTLMHALAHAGCMTTETALLAALRKNGPQVITCMDETEALTKLDDLFRLCDLSISFSQFWATHPNAIATISSHIKNLKVSQREKIYISNIFFNHARLYQKLFTDGPADGTVIFDEGFMQRVMTLCVTSSGLKANTDAIKQYTRAVPVPTTIIYLSTPIDVALSRLQSRESGMPPRMRAMDDPRRKKHLSQAADIFGMVLGMDHIAPVITVDTTQDLPTCTTQVLRGLQELSMTPRGM